MSGFDNDVMYAKNADFTQADNQAVSESNGLITNGQLWIGRSAVNAGGTHIDVNTITAGTGMTVTNGPGTITIASTASLTDLHTARFIVASSTAGTGANYTSITSAIADAVGTGINSTIFLQPGTYTENFTLPANINLCAYDCDALTPNVTIVGTITCTTAGSRSISGIRLQTNSAALLAVTGSAASVVNLRDCYLDCTNNTGVTFSSSSASAAINYFYCRGDLGTTGIGIYNQTSAGTSTFSYSYFTNSGLSTTANTISAGNVGYKWTLTLNPTTTSSTAGITLDWSQIFTTNTNTTCLTVNGTGVATSDFSIYDSGTASAISIGAGATLNLGGCDINSTNTNAITGSGTIGYNGLIFSGTSQTINVTSQSGGILKGGVSQAPSAGFIGENISNTVTNAAPANATAVTITSINLTPGIWDISALVTSSASGGTGIMTQQYAEISLVTNSVNTANIGISAYQQNTTAAGATILSAVVPQYRVTITTNTTYYLVVALGFSSTTCPTNGRISATRVG